MTRTGSDSLDRHRGRKSRTAPGGIRAPLIRTSTPCEEEVFSSVYGPPGPRVLATEAEQMRPRARVEKKPVTFYEGHTVVITHDAVEVWWPTHRRYRVDEIRGAYVSRGAS